MIVKICGFPKFNGNQCLLEEIYEILTSITIPWGHVRSLKKIVPDRFRRFDVYWIQTNRQTSNDQAKILCGTSRGLIFYG